MTRRRGPTYYRSMEEFEREELRPYKKAGWSLDDLYSEAKFNPAEDNSLDQEPKELDFDFG
ncbi:MAG: hypothetical protein AAGF12_30620 [Myxococcota bacterium]